MTIFLFTNFFPFRRSEPFLVNEFPFTLASADRVVVTALYGRPEERESDIPAGARVSVRKPVFASPAQKAQMFLRGIFNLSPCGHHLRDLFSHVRSVAQFRHWLTSLLLTRAALADGAFRDTVNEIRSTGGGVVYFYWGDNLAWTLPYIAKRISKANAAVAVRLHGTDLYESRKGGHIPLRPAMFKPVTLIVPVSADGKRYLLERYPAVKPRIWVSRLGVPDRGLNPAPRSGGSFTIVSVSAVIPVKRVMLIFESLVDCGLPVSWHHFGDGELFDDLRNAVAARGGAISVRLHGFVPNAAIIAFYQSTPVHLLVNASLSEGLPVSIMEALSFGIPVVATDTGGTSDLVDHTTGSLVPVNSGPGAIAAAVTAVLRMEDAAYAEMRAAARKRFGDLVDARRNYPEFYERLRDLIKG